MQKGFFASLFDISFSSFVTTKLIKVLYVLSLILIAVGYVVIAVAIFSSGGDELTFNETTGELEESGGNTALGALWLLVIGPLWMFLYVLISRVFYELVIVLFRIMENTRDQLAIMRGSGGPGPEPGTSPMPTPERP